MHAHELPGPHNPLQGLAVAYIPCLEHKLAYRNNPELKLELGACRNAFTDSGLSEGSQLPGKQRIQKGSELDRAGFSGSKARKESLVCIHQWQQPTAFCG